MPKHRTEPTKESSPTRKFGTQESTEGETIAFPALEGTVVSDTEAGQLAAAQLPGVTRTRRRSSSFREDQAIQAAYQRTAQNSPTDGSLKQDPLLTQGSAVAKPAIESPTKNRGHRRSSTIRENITVPTFTLESSSLSESTVSEVGLSGAQDSSSVSRMQKSCLESSFVQKYTP